MERARNSGREGLGGVGWGMRPRAGLCAACEPCMGCTCVGMAYILAHSWQPDIFRGNIYHGSSTAVRSTDPEWPSPRRHWQPLVSCTPHLGALLDVHVEPLVELGGVRHQQRRLLLGG